MNRIGKIFVGGQIHSGKNILWRLLDGHPTIVSNCMHSNIGHFILADDCKKQFLRAPSAIVHKTFPFIPMCKITYNTGEKTSISIGDFFRAMYTFSSYATFYSWAKGSSMFVNMKEGENERFPFEFDIHSFETKLEKALFTGNANFTEEEVLDTIYLSYINCLGNKNSMVKTQFVDTLPNGIGPAQTVANKIPTAKIIVLRRDLESLLFANAGRIMSVGHKVVVNKVFKKMLYNQKEFQKKISNFDIEATKLQAEHDNVMIVDFQKLILDTENTMRDIAKFLGIQYNPILSLPSINGEVIDHDKFPVLGKINDDPHKLLGESEVALLKYFLYGYDKKRSIGGNISVFVNAVKWRHLTKFGLMIGRILKTILPARMFVDLRNAYTRIATSK